MYIPSYKPDSSERQLDKNNWQYMNCTTCHNGFDLVRFACVFHTGNLNHEYTGLILIKIIKCCSVYSKGTLFLQKAAYESIYGMKARTDNIVKIHI